MSRRCWTCLQPHGLNEPCGASHLVQANRSAGGPGHELDDRTADLFDDVDSFGPIFAATFEGEDACCGEGILPGEDIRADGRGGWIHADDDCERMARK